jgi:hypothetical protein
VTPRHGVPRHFYDDHTDDQLREAAVERGWSPQVYATDELRRRLTEAQYPVFKLPDYPAKSPRGVVTWALVNHLGEPHPDGADRPWIVDRLVGVGIPDEETALQTVRQVVLNMVEYYGYTVLRDDERIILAKR